MLSMWAAKMASLESQGAYALYIYLHCKITVTNSVLAKCFLVYYIIANSSFLLAHNTHNDHVSLSIPTC